ncbi:hypothetical protein BDV96DRAFT_572544 [Lophiotrema nucula]|uniref:Uncharacterized protein n=1 Tax=Lophiotrema nucula TaxID=690887 RepID=A0A6A5ZCH4_9PLEO|nr:hypothetical protein BDV96DRAFT_572544 [Lophiotrema nucula]
MPSLSFKSPGGYITAQGSPQSVTTFSGRILRIHPLWNYPAFSPSHTPSHLLLNKDNYDKHDEHNDLYEEGTGRNVD